MAETPGNESDLTVLFMLDGSFFMLDGKFFMLDGTYSIQFTQVTVPGVEDIWDA